MAHAALAWVWDHQGNAEAALAGAEIAHQPQSERFAGSPHQGARVGYVGEICRSAGILEHRASTRSSRTNCPSGMHNRTVAYYLARDYHAAESATRQSIREYPDHPRAYVWRAAVLGQLGHRDAPAALDKAMSVAPGYFRYKTYNRAPYVRPEDHDHFLEGLSKAGWQSCATSGCPKHPDQQEVRQP